MNLERLIWEYVDDLKVVNNTTKVSNYYNNKEKPHELKSNVVYEYQNLKNKSIKTINKKDLKETTAVSDPIINGR